MLFGRIFLYLDLNYISSILDIVPCLISKANNVGLLLFTLLFFEKCIRECIMVSSGKKPCSREKSRGGSISDFIPSFKFFVSFPFPRVDRVPEARRVERFECTKVGGNCGKTYAQ